MPKINNFQDFEVAYAEMSKYVKSNPLENLREKKIKSFVKNSLLTFRCDEKVEKKIQEFSQKLRVLTNNKPYVTLLLKWETQTINGTIYPVCFTYTKSQQDIADKLTSSVDTLIKESQRMAYIASLRKERPRNVVETRNKTKLNIASLLKELDQRNVVESPNTQLKKRKNKTDSLVIYALMTSTTPPTIERFEELRKAASKTYAWGGGFFIF